MDVGGPKLIPCQEYIVVFKDTASQETINEQADQITKHGGSVTLKFDTVLRGFAAQIPPDYLLFLQNCLAEGDSQIAYIGKAGVIWCIPGH
ncbi:hypothetical protein F5148DRAFT_1284298 [Russula earlei]|uniref:Uncharacterized protein n=1 Tax=Russula earlei TaxID=71964 RepID=A0ACC0U9I8_9AGAM|nr:hypothetical protein F5148DRAFT_1284298 [Russula earlei]